MMDFTLNLVEGLPQMDFPAQDSMWNNIYLSLTIQKGSFFAAPEFGSDLHLLKKNTARTEKLLQGYVKVALKWLLDTGRAKSIDIITQRLQTRINYEVTIIKANGVPVSFQNFVEVV